MKKFLHPLVVLLVLVCAAACDKVPMNGRLDGMWQILTVETPQGVRDVKADRAYMSIQLHLTQWTHANRNYYSHFRHEGDSLCFYDFAGLSAHATAADDDPAITAAEMAGGLFHVYGIHTLDARYRIIHLSGSSLILESADTTLTFRKF